MRLEIKTESEQEWPLLRERLGAELAEAHEGLRFNVEREEYGTLPRFELKAKRLVDDRPVADYSRR